MMKPQTFLSTRLALSLCPLPLLVAAGAFGACADKFEYECSDGTTKTSGSGSANTCGPNEPAGAAGSGTSTGGTSGSGGVSPPPACDPAEQSDDAIGLFVDAVATLGGTGTRAAPFASLADAVAALAGREGATLYLRQSGVAYELTSTLTLPALAKGLTLDGGWGENWQRDCSPQAASKTVLRGTNAGVNPVLHTEGGALTLRRLTIQTADAATQATQGEAGSSLVVLHVTGATSLQIEASTLRAGEAGDGGTAASSSPGSGTRPCGGLFDCQTGASATTPTSDGLTDTAQLAASGFAPGNGQDGQPGTEGENGARDAKSNGIENASCVTCSGNSEQECEAPGNAPFKDLGSADGKCGCGGLGGPGGKGGRGGGASIVLWVGSTMASVNVVGSQLVAGEGGQGSPGGEGEQGTKGTEGEEGLSLCSTLPTGGTCAWSNGGDVCVPSPSTSVLNNTIGIAGGRGGNGGPGGKGGPGAGGPSYALVWPGAAAVQVDGSSALIAGQGGLSGDGASRAEGAAQKTY